MTGRLAGGVACRRSAAIAMPGLLKRVELLLLLGRQGLINLGESLAANGRKLADLATLRGCKLLDLTGIAGLDRGLERFAGLPQLLANRLSRLPGLLEDGPRLRPLGIRHVQGRRRHAEHSIRIAETPLRRLLSLREESGGAQRHDGYSSGKLFVELHNFLSPTSWDGP